MRSESFEQVIHKKTQTFKHTLFFQNKLFTVCISASPRGVTVLWEGSGE